MIKIIITDQYCDGENLIKIPTNFIIKDGIIVEIGKFTNIDDLKSKLDSETFIEDYRGYLLTTGLIDSHNHFTLTALKMRYEMI